MPLGNLISYFPSRTEITPNHVLVVYSNVIRHMCDTELWLVEIIDWGHVTPKYSIPIGREPAVYGHLPYRHDFW